MSRYLMSPVRFLSCIFEAHLISGGPVLQSRGRSIDRRPRREQKASKPHVQVMKTFSLWHWLIVGVPYVSSLILSSTRAANGKRPRQRVPNKFSNSCRPSGMVTSTYAKSTRSGSPCPKTSLTTFLPLTAPQTPPRRRNLWNTGASGQRRRWVRMHQGPELNRGDEI